MVFAIVYLSVVTALSLVSFAAYGFDKRQARRGGRRVSERTLHRLAWLGGWPGAWAGQKVFRHKTQKLGFRVIFWLGVLLHLTLVVGVLFWLL